MNVVSGKETRLPADLCRELAKRAILIPSEEYRKIREDIQKNCQMAQCTQLVGAFDGLFLAIDQGLRQLP